MEKHTCGILFRLLFEQWSRELLLVDPEKHSNMCVMAPEPEYIAELALLYIDISNFAFFAAKMKSALVYKHQCNLIGFLCTSFPCLKNTCMHACRSFVAYEHTLPSF